MRIRINLLITALCVGCPLMAQIVELPETESQEAKTKQKTKSKQNTRTWFVQGGVESIESIRQFDELSMGSVLLVHFYYKNDKNRDAHYDETTDLYRGLEMEIPDIITFGKVNIAREHLMPLTERYNIQRTPTFILFKNGKEVARLAKPVTMRALKEMIYDHFSKLIKRFREWEKKRRAELEEYRRKYGYRDYWAGPYWNWGLSPWSGYGFGPYWSWRWRHGWHPWGYYW